MFVGSYLQSFRERQPVSSLRHLEDGTVDLICPQVCETERFCFSFHEDQPLQCPGSVYMLHAAKSTTSPQLQGH